MSETVRVGPKYQVVIPHGIREKIGLQPKDEVLVEEICGTVMIIPKPKSFTNLIVGLGKELWEGVDASKYIQTERDSWK